MLINKSTNNNSTLKQLKLSLDLEKIIDVSDPVYTFCDVMDHIDLTPYFATFGNFTRNELTTSIERIFNDINMYIFEQDKVDIILNIRWLMQDMVHIITTFPVVLIFINITIKEKDWR